MHRETANTLNSISREQKIMFDHYIKLRKVLNENEKVRNMQLVKLCTDSEGALRNLRESLELAERIGIMFFNPLNFYHSRVTTVEGIKTFRKEIHCSVASIQRALSLLFSAHIFIYGYGKSCSPQSLFPVFAIALQKHVNKHVNKYEHWTAGCNKFDKLVDK